MGTVIQSRRAWQLAAALAATAAVTVCFHTWVRGANQTTVGFLYLLVVLAAASAFGFAEAILASLAATAQFNFFFLPPVGAFTIQDPRNWVALATFLITATVASRLSTSSKRRALEAEQRRRETARLLELSRASLLIDPANPVAGIERALVGIFAFRDVWIELPQRPPSTADGFAQHWPLRVGQRQLGILHVQAPAPSAEGGEAIAGIVAIALERSRLLTEASRLQALEASEALKSALLDSVAHDIRTPLTSIKAAVTALLGPDAGAVVRQELLVVINEESDALNRIVQNVLDMARIEAGDLRPTLRRQTLPPIIEDAIARARVDSARVRLRLDDALPAVRADGALLSQALRQLLANAAAYSAPASPIEVTAAAIAEEVRIEVRDHGAGIAPEQLPRLFEKFYRDPQARRARPEGLGMGLAIARGIVQAHHGRLTASSEPGLGSRFCITLPRQP